ncbi:ribonuclease H1-like [Leptopilina heterotoma]|uniref:ribonuclease H1-like n=1 Tax=Leptopilina heterotoma TaxID=63436 RepID=UPI001CA921FB|nr:ribonuclease H1-like [Leptopilina heterotoma]
MESKKYNLSSDETGFTNVYTDGACFGNGRSSPKAGIGVFFETDHPLNISAPVDGKQTNNAAELQAATSAVLQAQKAGITKLRINTDSQYVIRSCTEWIPRWKTNGWTKASGKPVENKEQLQDLDRAISSLEVDWKHVPGHSGHPGNSQADDLAKRGAKR